MKTMKTVVLCLLAALTLPLAAQEQADASLPVNVNNLLGCWNTNKEGADISIVLMEKNAFTLRLVATIEDEDMNFKLGIDGSGTWKLKDKTIEVKVDPMTFNFSYLGDDKEMGAMLEQMLNANKAKAAKEFAGSDSEMLLVVKALTKRSLQAHDPDSPDDVQTFVRVTEE